MSLGNKTNNILLLIMLEVGWSTDKRLCFERFTLIFHDIDVWGLAWVSNLLLSKKVKKYVCFGDEGTKYERV